MTWDTQVFVMFLWLALQIPLGLLVGNYIRAGSTPDPTTNAASLIRSFLNGHPAIDSKLARNW